MTEKNEISVEFLERKDERFIESYYDQTVTEYCMLDDDFKAIHPYVRCKDYIQDLFWIARQTITKDLETAIIYGFTPYKYLDRYPLIGRDIYRVGIRFRTKGQTFETIKKEHWRKLVSVLHLVEDAFEFPTSNVFVDKSKEIMVFEFNSKWTEKPYLLSFYLLFIRMLFRESLENLSKIKDVKEYLIDYPKTHSGSDSSFIHKSVFLLDQLFNKEFPEQSWMNYPSVSSVHNTSGIMSYSLLLEQTQKRKSQVDEQKKALLSE